MAVWRNGSASDYESGGCSFEYYLGHTFSLFFGENGWLFLVLMQGQNNDGTAGRNGVCTTFICWITVKLQLIVDRLVVRIRIRRGRRAAIQLRRNGVGDVLDFLEFLLKVISGS